MSRIKKKWNIIHQAGCKMKDDVLCVKGVVEAVLSEDERARNDDTWLCLQVLRMMGFGIFIPYKELDDMPKFESISRCRRKFQERGLFPAAPKVVEERRDEERKMKRIDEWL